jgi:hypothetical protein
MGIPEQYGSFLKDLIRWLREHDGLSNYVRGLIRSVDRDGISAGRHYWIILRGPSGRRVELGFHQEIYHHPRGSRGVKVFSGADQRRRDPAFGAEWDRAYGNVQGAIGYDERHAEYFIEREWFVDPTPQDYDRLLSDSRLREHLRQFALQFLLRLPRADDTSP